MELQRITNEQNELKKALPIAEDALANRAQAPRATEDLSEAAEDWMQGKEYIINNAEYSKLDPKIRKKLYPVRQEMANIARELLGEGWNKTDPSFYEEMDLRLGLKFDFYDALALEGVDALQSEGNKNLEEPNKSTKPSSGETSNPTKRTVEDRKKQVPVNGPTSSGSSTSSRKNSTKIRLSPDELRWYENHVRFSIPGQEISLKEYGQMVMDERKKQNG